MCSALGWALGMLTRGTLCASLTNGSNPCLFSPQRLCQLITPDSSLPQPKQHLYLDGSDGRDFGPSPAKEGLIAGEKETHL